MNDMFEYKLNNNEYISNSLYLKKLNGNKDKYSSFDIEKYNNRVLEKEYEKYKNYFEKMFVGIDENIHLDEEQIKAILADEDYSLIIAGAGTGKTTTMAAKVKYLVDKKGIDPSKILVMSFAKKATEELKERIQIDFNIPATISTFHSLGFMYIREIFYNRKCYVVDKNTRNEIFFKYFNENIFSDKEKTKEVLEIFDNSVSSDGWVFAPFFKNNYDKYDNYNLLFEAYKNKKLDEAYSIGLKDAVDDLLEQGLNRELVYTIKGELVKSKGEAIIANFLFSNNIDYEYEKIYEELVSDRKTYRPDFTINLAGQPVYIEYFGLSNYKDSELSTYEKIRKIKEEYHRIHNTKFVKIDYKRGENLIETLKRELVNMGFTLNPKSSKEIFMAILDNNKCALLYKFRDFLYKCIDLMKAYPNRSNIAKEVNKYILTISNEEERQIVKKQFEYIYDFYIYYQKKLYGAEDYGFDFSDMIYYANKYIERVGKNNKLNFEYIIIDEYQDISKDRYELTKKIATKNNSKIVAVGDDWQAIYGFSGSRVEYTYNFLKYFEGAKLFRITKTYRNSQALVNYSGKFVMKNDIQIKKKLISNKEIYRPVRFVKFEDGKEYEYLKKLILEINRNFPNEHILILGRTNKIINSCFDDDELIDSIGTKIKYSGYEDIDIDAMTIHKSKGLTSDEVILIGLDQNFPNSRNALFWLEGLFRPVEMYEPIPFAEERRLFYVALTRTKKYVYLLVNENKEKRSAFINEIYSIIKECDK